MNNLNLKTFEEIDEENVIIGTIQHKCPKCMTDKDFNIITGYRCQNYKGTMYTYLGVDAICPTCGHYCMFPEIVEINLNSLKTLVMHNDGTPLDVKLPTINEDELAIELETNPKKLKELLDKKSK